MLGKCRGISEVNGGIGCGVVVNVVDIRSRGQHKRAVFFRTISMVKIINITLKALCLVPIGKSMVLNMGVKVGLGATDGMVVIMKVVRIIVFFVAARNRGCFAFGLHPRLGNGQGC